MEVPLEQLMSCGWETRLLEVALLTMLLSFGTQKSSATCGRKGFWKCSPASPSGGAAHRRDCVPICSATQLVEIALIGATAQTSA